MRFFVSSRLPFGLRGGVIFDPFRGAGARPVRPGSTLAAFGEGVAGVYVITGAHNMCKIGISTDPDLRLAALQTGSHVPLHIHYVLAVKTIDPRVIEAEAHSILARHRCAGEWFDVTPQMAEDAVNEAAERFGIQKVTVTPDLERMQAAKKKRNHAFLNFAATALAFSVVFMFAVEYLTSR